MSNKRPDDMRLDVLNTDITVSLVEFHPGSQFRLLNVLTNVSFKSSVFL